MNKEDLKAIEDDLKSILIEMNKLYPIKWDDVSTMEDENNWKALAIYYKRICWESDHSFKLNQEAIRQTFNNLYILIKQEK